MNTSSKTSIKILNLVFLSLLLPSIQLLSEEPTATTAPTTTNPPSQSDRSGSSGAAGAAAAAGAAMAGLGCIMGLKAAQEAGPAEKPMLQMMAMQQCAQAAQNAASAAENNKQKDKLDAPPAAQGPGFQPPPQIKEPEDGKPVDLSKFAQNETKSDSKSETKLPNFDPPPLADASKKPEDGAGNPIGPIGPILPATSNPQVVDNSTITAKKDSKEDDANSAASKVLGSALGSRGAVDDLLKKALAENGTAAGQTPMIRPGGASGRNSAEASGENGGGFGGAESKADNSFDSLLAQMMGGGPQSAGMEMGMLNGGTQVVSLPKDKNGKPKLNIFQFASSLYSEMAHTTNRIMIHPLKTTTPSERSLATVTNTVAKASLR